MSENNISPKVYEIFKCLNMSYIIMDKWEGTIRELINLDILNKNHLDRIMVLIQKMHKLGIVHNDLHTANILYRVVNNTYEFSIIDFGLSLYFEDKTTIIPDSYLPRNNFPNIFYPIFDMYKFSSAFEGRSGQIFETYFYVNNYITPYEYLLMHKFFTSDYRSRKNLLFNKYIKNINKILKKIIKLKKI